MINVFIILYKICLVTAGTEYKEEQNEFISKISDLSLVSNRIFGFHRPSGTFRGKEG